MLSLLKISLQIFLHYRRLDILVPGHTSLHHSFRLHNSLHITPLRIGIATPNRNQKVRRIPTTYEPTLIHASIRGNIIIRKAIAPAIQIRRMHDPCIVVRDAVRIIRAHNFVVRLNGVDEQRAAVERCVEACANVQQLSGVGRLGCEGA